MLIDKTTSDPILVDTLVVMDANRRPISDVVTFDTDTLTATLGATDPVTASSYMFLAASGEDFEKLYTLLGSEFEPRIRVSAKKHKAKASISDVVTPDDYLTFGSASALQLHIAVCTKCAAKFLLFLDVAGGVWTSEKVGDGDTFQTMTQVAETGLTCDNCNNSVELLDDTP